MGHVERLSIIKQNHEALEVAQEPEKTWLEDFGNMIAQKMDILEGRMTSMSSVVLVLQNEKGETARDELESIAMDIPEKTEQVLT